MRVIYSFSCTIYRGQNQVIQCHKTLSPSGTFTCLSQVEEYIKQCKLRHLDLDDEEVWSKAYLPAARITNDSGVYEGCVNFTMSTFGSSHRMSCCWVVVLCPIGFTKSGVFIYAIDNMNDNLCVLQSLAIFKRIRHNWTRPAEDTRRNALNLACEFYKQPNLLVSDVRPTKPIDLKNIALRFQVNIRLYKSLNNSVWMLAFGQVQHRKSLPNIDISLYEGHCFYIKDLNILANHWNELTANKDSPVMIIMTDM